MRIVSYLGILAFLNLFVEGQILRFSDQTLENIKDSATVTKDWEILQNVLKNLASEGVKVLMPLLMDGVQDLNISSSCIRDTLHVIAGIRKLRPWAFRYIDSTSKLVDGLMSGTYSSYGDYDECVDTVVLNQRSGKQKGEVMFTGKYCILRIKPSLPPEGKKVKKGEILDELKGIYKANTILSEAAKYGHMLYPSSIRLALCIPSGCSADDVNQVFQKAADYTRLYMKVKSCEVKEELKYTPMMIFVMSFYSFTGFVVLVATSTDIYCHKSGKMLHSTPVRLLLAFSFISNFRKLVNTSTASESLSCFNGIRFLTMSWVILCHGHLMLAVSQVLRGLLIARQIMQEDFAFQVAVNSVVAVDTFFFIGGFLVCYVATKHVKISGRNFSIKVYIFHRLWRILPVLSFVTLYMFIAELVTTGPIANELFRPFVDACKNNWWPSFLFINNVYHPEDTCLPHTWYLGVDMQLYIASLIILLPLFRWPKVGISIAVLSILASMIANAVVIYVKDLPPTFDITAANVPVGMDFMRLHYFMPYPHAGPYILGILAGYFVALNPDLKIPKVALWLGWSCAIIFSTTALYGPFEWNKGREPTFWETMFFGACHEVAWSLGIAWMVICCATGHGGIVNYILSWKVWIPLGRLTYTAYLAHFIVEISYIATSRSTYPAMHVVGVWLFFGHLAASYGVAFVVSMLIESPLMTIEKYFLPQRSEKPQRETEQHANHALTTMELPKENYAKDSDAKLASSETCTWTGKEQIVYKL